MMKKYYANLGHDKVSWQSDLLTNFGHDYVLNSKICISEVTDPVDNYRKNILPNCRVNLNTELI